MKIGVWVVVSAIAALLCWTGGRLYPESSPVARGATHAHAGGCIDCHGQPGADYLADLRSECTQQELGNGHPPYEGECPDVLAYFEAVRLKRTFGDRANGPTHNRLLQGERLAREYNCFQCHGELGQGGFPNRGALKGYIPGYFGNDFAALTQGGRPESVRAWIRRGVDQALFEHPVEGPIAEFFVQRQAVQMPRFDSLSESEIGILTDYVVALNRFGPMDVQALRAYGRLTQQALVRDQRFGGTEPVPTQN